MALTTPSTSPLGGTTTGSLSLNHVGQDGKWMSLNATGNLDAKTIQELTNATNGTGPDAVAAMRDRLGAGAKLEVTTGDASGNKEFMRLEGSNSVEAGPNGVREQATRGAERYRWGADGTYDGERTSLQGQRTTTKDGSRSTVVGDDERMHIGPKGDATYDRRVAGVDETRDAAGNVTNRLEASGQLSAKRDAAPTPAPISGGRTKADNPETMRALDAQSARPNNPNRKPEGVYKTQRTEAFDENAFRGGKLSFNRGDSGSSVRQAQEFLAKQGYLHPSRIDGKWGPEMEAVFKHYQANGMKPNPAAQPTEQKKPELLEV